ncbi:hypothetical protein [Sphingobium sp. CFD-2]|uniref:hypothetical protein n=1 Tax=Sphingobium sp. CFD-2 TaxID=2878542 RepID=UPI00214BC2ED|nr:hypothetical protein [Sphingobium sp. CFD-2]
MQARTGLILSFALVLAIFASLIVNRVADVAASIFDPTCVAAASEEQGQQCPAARLMIAQGRANSGSSGSEVEGQ